VGSIGWAVFPGLTVLLHLTLYSSQRLFRPSNSLYHYSLNIKTALRAHSSVPGLITPLSLSSLCLLNPYALQTFLIAMFILDV